MTTTELLRTDVHTGSDNHDALHLRTKSETTLRYMAVQANLEVEEVLFSFSLSVSRHSEFRLEAKIDKFHPCFPYLTKFLCQLHLLNVVTCGTSNNNTNMRGKKYQNLTF